MYKQQKGVNMFHDPDSYDGARCAEERRVRQEHEELVESYKSTIQEIVDMIYSNNKLDLATLDDCLSWLAGEFHIKTPDGQPNVIRKSTVIESLTYIQKAV